MGLSNFIWSRGKLQQSIIYMIAIAVAVICVTFAYLMFSVKLPKKLDDNGKEIPNKPDITYTILGGVLAFIGGIGCLFVLIISWYFLDWRENLCEWFEEPKRQSDNYSPMFDTMGTISSAVGTAARSVIPSSMYWRRKK